MARSSRGIPPGAIVELTNRTVDRLPLFRPTPAMTRRLYEVIARAQFLYPVRLHAFTFLPDQVRVELSVDDGAQLARFACHLLGNSARLAQDLTGRVGPVWAIEPAPAPILDELTSVQCLRSILASGVDAGLVRSPLDWPGATSARAQLRGELITTTWQTRLTGGRARKERIIESTHAIQLAPLPCWAGLAPDRQRFQIAALIREIEVGGQRQRLGVG